MSETTENNKTNYKETINLPQTDFPMKGNLPVREPEIISNWQKIGIYEKMLEKNAANPPFYMPDGPPYANGNIHIGHVLNKVLKDIVIKYKNLSGKRSAFIPGWDCHGLPIEHKVTKELGAKKKDKTAKDIRELCRNEAKKWVNLQREQFVRLGILAEWENPYLTIDPDYEAEEVRELARALKNGYLYRGEKPVYWCWALQTALAEAEVEYANHKSPSIYVRFEVKEGLERLGSPDKPTYFVIWTTTPWTLPANLGIALYEDFEYGLFENVSENGKENLILASDLQEVVEKTAGIQLKKIASFKGKELEGMTAKHPFIDRDSVVVLGHHVSLEAGTGCVHMAPGHGQDDYIVGLKYGLKIYSPVDDRGCYTADVPEYEGQQIFKCNPLIVERLQKSGHLLHHTEIEHSYPHCWRSKTPLIFRATPQWFLAMDQEGHSLRQKTLQALDEIQFVPDWGSKRLRAMIENRPDWCLSRQRSWGVPIPVFYCQNCKKELINYETLMRVADLMEKNQGIEAYFEGDTKELVGDQKCSSCGHDQFDKGQDILDVWFDSGACHAAVQRKRDLLDVPADIYLEGSDQHRGWFQTSLLSSMVSTGHPPFKTLVTHGFVNDAKGRKMSKSLGNVIDPAEWIKKSGAEILRLFTAYEDYSHDLNCGPENFKRVTESYRRYRNTMRFLIGNLHDFNPEEDRVDLKEMTSLDLWALHRLNVLIEKVTASYEGYEFYKVYHALNHFMTVELSATYLDILKDRLYTWKGNGLARRSAQTVLFELLNHLVTIMAPILSFLAEESYAHIPGNKEESVFLTSFPKTREEWKRPDLDEDFSNLLEVRSAVLKEIEILRAQKSIRSSLEAEILIKSDGNRFDILQKYKELLPELFIVSQVELSPGEFSVRVEKAKGEKCERCWIYSQDIGECEKHPTICKKCVEALS